MTSREKLMYLVGECKDMIEDCGFNLPYIQYEFDNATKRLGQCQRRGNNYKIKISQNYFEEYIKNGEEEKIKDTILHEMCHALPNGMNHKSQWQFYANKVNRLFGYNIKRLADSDDVSTKIVQNSANYIIECLNCGHKYYYQRMTSKLKNLNNCSCGKCKGKLQLI